VRRGHKASRSRVQVHRLKGSLWFEHQWGNFLFSAMPWAGTYIWSALQFDDEGKKEEAGTTKPPQAIDPDEQIATAAIPPG